MNYADIRPTIRSGDLLAFSHGSWRTWREIKTNAVRVFTRSTYSHVGLAWVVGGRVFVLEAVKPEIRIYPLSISGDFYLVPMRADWSPATEEFAIECVGTDYSEIDAIRAYLHPLEAGNVNECAAYVREVLKRENIDLGDRSTPDAVVLAAQKRKGSMLIYVENGNAK